MTVDQDTARTEPGKGDLALHNGWFDSGWMHVLPPYQAMLMSMLLATAASRPVTGTLDEVAWEAFGDSPRDFLHGLGDDLDSPVLWLEPGTLAAAEDAEEEAGIRAEAAARRAACEGALRAGGFPVPATIRDLVGTMLALGIAHTEDGRWWMPEDLPLPEDVLDLPEGPRETLRKLRQVKVVAPWKQALSEYLHEALGRPGELFTTPGRLAEAVGLSPDEVRAALDAMVDYEQVRLYRGIPRVPVASARDLQDHQRFHLVPDWEQYDEDHAIMVRYDGREG
ncbi:DUF6042 family protein [Streptomyces sp. NPDC055103]